MEAIGVGWVFGGWVGWASLQRSEWTPLIDPELIFKTRCLWGVCSGGLGFFLVIWDRLCMEFRSPLHPKNPVKFFNAHCLHVCNCLKSPLDVSAILGVGPRNAGLASRISASTMMTYLWSMSKFMLFHCSGRVVVSYTTLEEPKLVCDWICAHLRPLS